MEALISEPFYSALLVGLGLILFLLEIFVPSGGVLGVIAFLLAGLGVYGFFHQGRPVLGGGAILLTLGSAAAILAFGLKRLRMEGTLSPDTTLTVDQGISDLVGKEGTAISPLRPAGIARIDGRRIDVVASGRFIEKDTPVRVVETSGNRVVVRAIVSTGDEGTTEREPT